MDIEKIKSIPATTFHLYEDSGDNQLWLEQFRQENQNYADYEGREILELMQNADDAHSSNIDIVLNTEEGLLTIKNYGPDTIPFTEKGIRSIMSSHLSPKKEEKGHGYIGSKGLGFKSVLNWATEVVVKSDNIQLVFGNSIVAKYWSALKKRLGEETIEEYENEAKLCKRIIPLPVLRLPEIEEWITPERNATLLHLYYDKNKEGRIVESLKSIRPETLLFLHNLRHINLTIDNKTLNYKIEKKEIAENIREATINSNKWLISHSEGEWETGELYEAAVAYPLNFMPDNKYEIFSFFPTKEFFPFPCVIHATLELNASRNALLSGESINEEMMVLIAERMVALADLLKSKHHGWQSFMLIHGSTKELSNNPYVEKLKICLKEKSNGMELVPVLNGEYSSAEDSYFYNNEFFDFIEDNGKEIFSHMRLKNPPFEIKDDETDRFAATHIVEYADNIPGNLRLAQYIKVVHDFYRNRYLKTSLPLLRDSNGDRIKGVAYLNTGRFVRNIPEFMNINYVAKDLADNLVTQFGFSGKDAYRDLASELKRRNVVTATATDISVMKRMLVLKSKDEQLSKVQKQEILKCLLDLYLDKRDEFKKSRDICYLPTESGEWQLASQLVFGDKRFPDGFRNLGLTTELYEDKDYVAFPDFLLIDNLTPNVIQDFFCELGVNKYFPTESRHFGDDMEFVKKNNLNKPQILQNCISSRTGKDANSRLVPLNIEKWNTFNIQELMILILKSGLWEEILRKDELNWYYGKGWFKEDLKIDYLPFLLRKHTAAKYLDYYILEANEWLLKKKEFGNFQYDRDDSRISLLLERLGAKKDYSMLSPNELYQLINDKADEVKASGDTKGIKGFYQRIKRALHLKNASSSEFPLRMLCRQNGDLLIKYSTEIFYSDDIGNEALRNLLPVLEMGTREGELQVKRYFGCKLIKEIKTILIESEPNETITKQLADRIETLRPYILAYATKNIGSRGGSTDEYFSSTKGIVEKFSITVVSKAYYKYDIDIEGLSDMMIMKDGDLIYQGDLPIIKYAGHDLKSAIQNPEFCYAIVNALCISLKITVDENADRFYRLLKSSSLELNYMVTREIEWEIWEECRDSFVVSEEEIEFWRSVFEKNKKNFDEEELLKSKRNYIMKSLGVTYDRTTPEKFKLFHLQKLKEVRNKYTPEYLYKTHSCLQYKSMEEKSKYITYMNKFMDESWLNGILDMHRSFLLSLDYEAMVLEALKDNFDFVPDVNPEKSFTVPSQKEEYLQDHSIFELSLSDKDKSLLYFEGYDAYFENLIERLYPSSQENESKEEFGDPRSSEKEKSESIPMSIVTTIKREEPIHIIKKNSRGHSRRIRISDNDRKRLGENAEDLVYKALTASDSEFVVGTVYSSYLCKKYNLSPGDDSKGYDLEYRHKDESIFRCLEIKHSDGKSVIMSRNEYEVARNPELQLSYDIALVVRNEIMIWKDAFKDESSFAVTSDTVTLCFDIKR